MKASIITFFAVMIWGCLIMMMEEEPLLYAGIIGWCILNIVFTTKLERTKRNKRWN